MKTGDLIEVCSAKVTIMYNENFHDRQPVPQGIIGIVLEVAGKHAFAVGYVKVLLSGDRVGFIYKDALRVVE